MFFPLLYSPLTRQTTCIPSFVPWKQRPKSNKKKPNHGTTWTLGNFSCAWIVFHQSNKTSLHHVPFPCKQPAFSHVFKPHCPTLLRKIQMRLTATNNEFFRLHSITYFTHRWQCRWATTNQGALFEILSFLLLNVSSFIRDRNISLVRVYWRYNRVSNTFHSKITWNYIFQATNCRRKFLIFCLLAE